MGFPRNETFKVKWVSIKREGRLEVDMRELSCPLKLLSSKCKWLSDFTLLFPRMVTPLSFPNETVEIRGGTSLRFFPTKVLLYSPYLNPPRSLRLVQIEKETLSIQCSLIYSWNYYKLDHYYKIFFALTLYSFGISVNWIICYFETENFPLTLQSPFNDHWQTLRNKIEINYHPIKSKRKCNYNLL